MTAKFPSPGEVFEDTYRIEAILGSGGFARVYRAIETGLERPVALKILRPPVSEDESDSQRDNYLETLMERFQREALMLSKLRSNYTVSLYKYGKTDDGLLYMALEYIDGLSLAEILRAGKPLDPARVVKILIQVLSSLQEAHGLGMLHRDLKPANVMVYEHLGDNDQVKLLDFGIAKLVNEQPGVKADLTSDGTLIGTPRYMAPEQIQGSELGPPADIYALGLVAYELLTAERAIKGDSSIQIIGKQLAPQSFQLPAGDKVPERLREVVNKMILKEIDERFVDCAEVIEALQAPDILEMEIPELDLEFLEIDDAPTIRSKPNFEDAPAFGTKVDRDDTKDEPLPVPAVGSNRTPLLIGAGVLALFLAIGLAFAFGGGDDPEQVEPAEPAVLADSQKPDEVEEPVPEIEEEPKVANVKITARLDGKDLEGATVLVNGVEKGVTPLTLEAPEVENARVVARYKLPEQEDVVEEIQEVTVPRDVLLEFDAVVGNLIPPDEKADNADSKPAAEKPKPRPRPRPRPKRDPEPKKKDNPYDIVPE